MAHVTQRKKEAVKHVEKLLGEYPVVGVVDLVGLPAAQFQKMRVTLRNKMVIFVTKKRLMKIAIEDVKDKKQNISGLKDALRGVPGLIFTKENPFKLYKLLEKSKSNTFAKPGQLAPKDLIIPAGQTPFGPGPIIGELGQLGIKAGIEAGKVVIKQDFTAAKEGQPISDKIASFLMKMGVTPVEIGLNLTAVYENGSIFKKDVLAIDEAAYADTITTAARWALNLSVEAAVITRENRELLLGKAFKDAKAVALDACIVEKDVIDALLGKAAMQATSVKNEYNI